MKTFKLLDKLTSAPGPSGNENDISAVIKDLWQPYVDEISVDRVGSLHALRRGRQQGDNDAPRRRVMLAAHQDEIGLLVSKLVEHRGSGFLRVTSIGGVDRRHLIGQTVVVQGREPLVGVINALPDRMLAPEKRDRPHDYEVLVVDVGLPYDELLKLVRIGDFAVFRQPLRKLLSGRAAGKAIDNRGSVAAVTICLKALQNLSHEWDVLAVATSQEETRLLGAETSAFALSPDIAIAIDVTHGIGPGAGEHEAYRLGGGPVLGIGVNVHPGVFEALINAAESLEMDVAVEPHARASGTDTAALQTVRAGIPTGLVQIPLRYMHTMVETVQLADIKRVGRLLAEFIIQLDSQFLDQITSAMMEPEA